MKLPSFRFPVVALLCLWAVTMPVHAQLQRMANTTLMMPPAPPTFGYVSSNAFPGLVFTNPVGITTPPGETNRLFVVGKNGFIYVITNLATPSFSIFMDISNRVTSTGGNNGVAGEQGLLSLAFDPGYATNNSFYVFYTGQSTNGTGSSTLHHFLSRFKTITGNTNQGDPNSETVLYVQYKRAQNHNGGDMKFGPDGYLYVSVGDEGNEHDTFTNAQHITWRLWSGILRLDVDKIDPLGLLPNTNSDLGQIYSKSTNYFIPHDNPFVGATTFDGQAINSNNVQTEFWATGLRNPWRMSFDPLTGNLFCADVGQDQVEEADIITRGGNYGWAWWEGATNPPLNVTATILNATPVPQNPIAPFVNYVHGSATNQGNCIIGGIVYRGQNLSQLYGYYIFADYVSGRVWTMPASQAVALTQSNLTVTPPAPIFTETGISSFGIDPRNGDILYTSLSGNSVKRIVYNTTTNGVPLPPTLYDTGAFTNLMSLTGAQNPLQPASGILPYAINVPFWSDNAIKSRWFSVPDTNQTIVFSPNGNWSFPTGTVWIKHFNLQLTNGDPSSEIRLETRLLVKNAAGVYGVTYRWGASKTNATLVDAGGMDESFIIHDGGIVRTQVWHYPSQIECQTCHTAAGGFGLGFRTEQLNDNYDYGFGPTNEIQALSAAGYFSAAVTNDVHSLIALATATNTAASLEFRARSFLMANCSQCHQPGGTVSAANWDARIATPTALAGLINSVPVNNLGYASNYLIAPHVPSNSVLLTRIATRGAGSIQMPPLASSLVDATATNLLTQWILSLTNMFWIGGGPDLQTVAPGNSVNYTITYVATPDFTNNVSLSASGLPAGATAVFNPVTVNKATTNSTLTVSTSGALTPQGSYSLIITGAGGGVSATDTVTLAVSSIVTAPAGMLFWTGASGADTNWSTPLNWTNVAVPGYGVPGVSNDVVFNNVAAGLTNSEDYSTTINSLWYALSPPSGGMRTHMTRLQPGTTLNIIGTNLLAGNSFVTAGYSLLVGTNASVTGNGNNSSVAVVIAGTNAAVNINRPDGVVAVAEYISTGNHPVPAASTRAILDLSLLDNFAANISQLLVGCMANGSAGTLYLARTNSITIANGSSSGTAGLDVGNNGSNPGDPSFIYLGLTNHLNVNYVRTGGQKGYYGTIAFNPLFTNQNAAAVARGNSGDNSRVSVWMVGDLVAATGTANVTCPRGTNDFTGGTVDFLVSSLLLGKTGSGTQSPLGAGTSSNRVATGTLTFNAGTIDVDNIVDGYQIPGDLTDTGIGVINVNGGRLVVNTTLIMASGVANSWVGGNFTGVTIVTNLLYGANFNATNAFAQGTLNVNGGTVLANQIASGGGVTTIGLKNGTLVLTNTAKTISYFGLTNSILRLNLNGNGIATNIVVTNLVASGLNTIAIDSVTNVTGATNFPLIAYTSFTGSVSNNFVKGALPPGFSASLLDNATQHRIDLVIAQSTNVTPRFGNLNVSGSNLIFNGSNGLPGGNYYVLSSSNVALPLGQWTRIATNPFDLNGAFNFTNGIGTNASLFYLLQLQ
jgi:uncharacterized repeat protein (TIGR03806 family)